MPRRYRAWFGARSDRCDLARRFRRERELEQEQEREQELERMTRKRRNITVPDSDWKYIAKLGTSKNHPHGNASAGISEAVKQLRSLSRGIIVASKENA